MTEIDRDMETQDLIKRIENYGSDFNKIMETFNELVEATERFEERIQTEEGMEELVKLFEKQERSYNQMVKGFMEVQEDNRKTLDMLKNKVTDSIILEITEIINYINNELD